DSLIRRALKYDSKHPKTQKPSADLELWQKISHLFQASLMGKIDAMETLLEYGVDIDANGCPDGSALMAACSTGRLESAQFLVRKGAKLTYVDEHQFRSAFTAANKFPEVLRWLLVECHTQQLKLEDFQACGLETESGLLKPWAGLQELRIPWKGRFPRYNKESSFEHFLRLRKIQEDLQGKVILWTTDPPDIFVAL
ncbi:hypothetical protein IWX90DRAFT_496633, partial [Phyllosticta citrichinensis]